MNQTVVGRMALGCSVIFHAWVFSGEAGATASRPTPIPAQAVEFVVTEPEPPQEQPEAPPEPQEPESTLTPEPRESQLAAREAEDPVAQEAPPELTGTTLLAEEGADFAAPPGSGRARRGAFRSGVSREVASGPKVSTNRPARRIARSEPSFVPIDQLSRLPGPPDLGDLLQRNYPSAARRQGKSGEAKVRARIEPNGRVERANVTFETADGFGRACRDTLLGSRWSSPRDEKGKRVATWVSYRCKFRIDG